MITLATDNPLTALTLDELRTRSSMKWRTHPADVLPLWVAEMDVAVAPPVKDAIIRAVEHGDTGYPAGNDYQEAIAAFAAQRWGWSDVPIGRSAVVPDVMMGIVETLRLVSEPGDAVVMCPPVYAPFFAFVAHADRRIVEAPLGADQRFDFAAIEEAFVRAARLGRHPVFLISNPHNPTGFVPTRAELERVAELAERYGVRVISDEIHAPLVYSDAVFTPYLSVSDDGFALLSASKAWNLAGLKAAVLFAGERAASDFERLPEEVSHGPSHLGVIAHTVAFQLGGAWLDTLLAGLESNRELLGSLLARHLPGVTWKRPEATYLAWLDCSAVDIAKPPATGGELAVVTDLAGPALYFLDNARVALSSGHVFGTGGADHVRLNFATNPDILTEAIVRMGRSLPAAAPS